MAVSAGTRLGPYEITAPLGAGGMGEVYRARDSRLGREVALKVLPAGFSNDAVRRARFEQEARAAAALSHPNVVGLHDIGNDGDVFYIITELIAGETLAALIERGPLPTRKLLDIAVQVADGMAGAHAAGITHRDLKPANIMIAPDGRAKILDFGLAKQSAPATVPADATVTVHQTEPGMIVGTVNYMSPEQARGRMVDYRSDQFSFGLILYEMATGKKAFEKPESVQTMSAILTEEPPPIERTIPAPLRWAIERCLAKDPADRYESSRDLFQDLRSLRDHLSEVSTTQTAAAPIATRSRNRWRLIAALVALVLIMALGTGLFLTRPQVPDQSNYRFTPFSFETGGQASPVWSPDSKAVAYEARPSEGPSQIFIRYLDSATPVQLTHDTEDAAPVAWTPDGKRILFRSPRKPPGFWSISTVGGEPQFLMPTGDTIVSSDFSSDGKALAMFQKGPDDRFGMWISAPPGSPPTKYSPDPFASREVYNVPQLGFSPDGKQILLWFHGRNREEAWLMPYPANSSQPPRLRLQDLPTYGGTPKFSWMPDSRHIVISLHTQPGAGAQLWIADTRSGARHALTSGTASLDSPTVSPDGRKMIFTGVTGNYDIVSVDLKTAAAHNLIATERNELMPAWAAKQAVLVYVTDRNGPMEIWLHSSGNGDRPVVTARDFPPETTQWLMGPSLSPDGDRVIYTRIETRGGTHNWISAASGGAPVQLTDDAPSSEFPGSWSPDGAWYTYFAIRNGRADLMKVKTIGQASPVVLKANVQNFVVPSCSPTGEWIAYYDHGWHLMSPDGKTTKPLGDLRTPYLMFSADGKLVYGLRGERDRLLLFSVDIATGSEKIIGDVGKDFRPRSNVNPSTRFSLAPDGKSFVYGTGKVKYNLWMLEGFAQNTGLLARLGLR